MSTANTAFLFKFVHPTLYAHTVTILAPDYNAALTYAQDHCTGTLWSIARATNMTTGQVVSNG